MLLRQYSTHHDLDEVHNGLPIWRRPLWRIFCDQRVCGGQIVSHDACLSSCIWNLSNGCRVISISTRGIAGPARSGYEYAGCFADSSVHVMAQMVQTVNSVAWCTQACYARGYSVAGLEAGTQCWCANSVPTTTSTSCTISCSGGSGTCGGNLALDVYVA